MSLSVSPFSTDDPLALSEIVSAESRLAASSNDDDVRVEASKKTLSDRAAAQRRQLLDLALGDRLEAGGELQQALDRRPVEILAREQMARAGARAARGLEQDGGHAGTPLEHDLVGRVVLAEVHVHALGARGRQVLADDVGADRQLAVAAVAEHREADARRAAVVEDRLDRGAHGAPRVEHVVDDHDRRAVEREVERRGLDDRLRMRARLAAAQAHVVAVERDVERADRHLDAAISASSVASRRASVTPRV